MNWFPPGFSIPSVFEIVFALGCLLGICIVMIGIKENIDKGRY